MIETGYFHHHVLLIESCTPWSRLFFHYFPSRQLFLRLFRSHSCIATKFDPTNDSARKSADFFVSITSQFSAMSNDFSRNNTTNFFFGVSIGLYFKQIFEQKKNVLKIDKNKKKKEWQATGWWIKCLKINYKFESPSTIG